MTTMIEKDLTKLYSSNVILTTQFRNIVQTNQIITFLELYTLYPLTQLNI